MCATNPILHTPTCKHALWGEKKPRLCGMPEKAQTGAPGFEPRSTAPKAGVLPLHHAPMRGTLYHSDWWGATPHGTPRHLRPGQVCARGKCAPCASTVCYFGGEGGSFGFRLPVNFTGMVFPGVSPSLRASSKVITSGLVGMLLVFSTASFQKASRS